MKLQSYISAAILATVFSLGGCVKDTLYQTAHPDEGTMTVNPNFTPAPGDPDAPQPKPEEVNIKVTDSDGNTIDLGENPGHLFTPGDYTVITTTEAEGITVDGTEAAVDKETAPDGWQDNGPFVDGNPDWFFSAVEDLTINRDSETGINPDLRQQIRSLTIILTPTGDAADRITGINAILTGVAGSMDFAHNIYGEPSSVVLPFAMTDEGKWTATVRLLGITGNLTRAAVRQLLIAKVRFTDDNPLMMRFESDLSEELKDFNTDKRTPLTLGGSMLATPNQAGITATITDWQVVENDDIEIK